MANGVVLVTGGAKRIGRAICLRLAADGYSLIVHYRGSVDEAEGLVEHIRSSGGSALAIHADLSDAASAASLVLRAGADSPLCGIVNNASVFVHDDIDSIDTESWDAHMEVNARSPMLLIRALNQQLGEDDRACVVNVLDQKIAEPPEDVADAVSYLMSAEAVTGQVLFVDSGERFLSRARDVLFETE